MGKIDSCEIIVLQNVKLYEILASTQTCFHFIRFFLLSKREDLCPASVIVYHQNVTQVLDNTFVDSKWMNSSALGVKHRKLDIARG